MSIDLDHRIGDWLSNNPRKVSLVLTVFFALTQVGSAAAGLTATYGP